MSTEEYLEAIYILIRDSNTMSATIISKCLKITPAGVSGMLVKLADSVDVNYLPYQAATTTPQGLEVVDKMSGFEIYDHNLVFDDK